MRGGERDREERIEVGSTSGAFRIDYGVLYFTALRSSSAVINNLLTVL